MPDRSMKIAKLIGSTPALAYCDLCKLTFRTRPELIVDAEKARQQLQADFEKHECRPEPEAIDDALIHIKRAGVAPRQIFRQCISINNHEAFRPMKA